MSPRASTRALTRLNTLFDRDELATALAASADPRERQLGQMLASPDDRFSKLTVAGLASRLGLSHAQIMTAFRQYKRDEAIVEVARRAPAIVRDIASDALNREITCSACKGAGRIVDTGRPGDPITTEMCIPCEGSGKVILHGDPTARKQALEIMELTGRGQTTINAPGGQMVVATEGSLEEALKRMRQGANGGNGGGNVEGTVGGTITLDGDDGVEDTTGGEEV